MTSPASYVAILQTEGEDDRPVRHPFVLGKPVFEIRETEVVAGVVWVQTFELSGQIDADLFEYQWVSYEPQPDQ